jgi:hypothetical protein
MPPEIEDIATIENLARTPHPALRWAELIVLFAAMPTLFWLWRLHPEPVVRLLDAIGLAGTRLARPGRFMLPTLALFTLACLALLLLDRSFPKRRLWNARAALPALPWIFARFAAGAALLTAFTWQLEPGAPLRAWAEAHRLGGGWPGGGPTLFGFPRQHPAFWAIIMVFYPVASVWPQEVLYRAFFFHRYGRILPRRWLRVAVSGLAFGFMHIVFMNPVAPTLCLLGGLLFARTYSRTHSVLAASVEHALYGCWVFTVGLGSFFYGGTYGGVVGG